MTRVFLLIIISIVFLVGCSKDVDDEFWTEDRANAFLTEQENSLQNAVNSIVMRIEPSIIYINNMPDFLMMFVTNYTNVIQTIERGYMLEFYDGENWIHLNTNQAFFDTSLGMVRPETVRPGETFGKISGRFEWLDGTLLVSGKYRIRLPNTFGCPSSVFFILD
ncbi:MAG: hypothetical protein FWE44_06790 [Defluviitaleaceae bacterium]|nr:hypothetical protein [Defluviitaleaceae bacterium]